MKPAMKTRTRRADVKGNLTKRQAKFLIEFPKDLNATQAAIRAGYSKKTAAVKGCQLVKLLHDRVKVFVKPPEKALAPAALIGLQRYVNEIERLSYFDSRKLFDSHGNPIEIPKLSDEVAPVIAGFEITEEFEGKGSERRAVGYTKKFKLVDKIQALALLGKVHGFYREKTDRLTSPLEQAATEMLLTMQATIEQRQRERHA